MLGIWKLHPNGETTMTRSSYMMLVLNMFFPSILHVITEHMAFFTTAQLLDPGASKGSVLYSSHGIHVSDLMRSLVRII